MTLQEVLIKYKNDQMLQNYVTVRQAKNTGLIPKIYWEKEEEAGKPSKSFPDLCRCGSENVISTNLKRAKCCDPRCPIKVSLTMSDMFSNFGIKGVGDAICEKMTFQCWKNLQYKSHLEILMLPYEKYPASIKGTAAGETFFMGCAEMRKKTMTFPEMVSKLGLESLGTNAKNLLEEFSCAKEMFDELSAQGAIAFCSTRGVQDRSVVNSLYVHAVDILLADQFFSQCLRRRGFKNLSIAITGRVYVNGSHYTKENFVQYCNKRASYRGVQIIEVEMRNSAVETVDYIVADSPSNSAKYRAGTRRGNLITSKDLLDLIESEVELCKQKIEERESSKQTSEKTLEKMNDF